MRTDRLHIQFILQEFTGPDQVKQVKLLGYLTHNFLPFTQVQRRKMFTSKATFAAATTLLLMCTTFALAIPASTHQGAQGICVTTKKFNANNETS